MNMEQSELARLKADADLATRASQSAADKVAELEGQLAAARTEWETAKQREMEARRAFAVAEDAQPAGS